MAVSRTPQTSREGAFTHGDRQGLDYLSAAGGHGVGISYGLLDGGTGATIAVTFAALGMKDMANNTYAVHVQAEMPTTEYAHVDESTKTLTGFTIMHNGSGTAAFSNETLNIIVVGQIADQLGADGPA